MRSFPWLLALVLAGCGSSWKAPLESRDTGSRGYSQSAKQPIRTGTYRVRRGDTLYAIAWRAGKDHRSIARWNNIRPPYVIYPGQVLRLEPRRAARKTTSTTTARTSKSDSRRTQQKRSTRQQAKTTTQRRATAPKTAARSLKWSWPAQGPLLSRFSASDPTRKGIKIGGKSGQTVRAAEGGRVVYSGSGLIGYGQLIIIKHNDAYLSAYGHNAKLLVKEGDQVAKGKQIAAMGRSNEGKPMLHFEIRRDGKPVDPLRLMPRR